MVTMRDGVRISVRVYRPADAARFPALFAASPYQYEIDTVPAYPLFLWRETGPIEWYVEQGYAYVHADVRGSGGSEGEFGFMDPIEQQDYVELIAWIITQDWCNGKVGGIGQSYYAMAQWLMATHEPAGARLHRPTTAWSTNTAARTITAASTAATARLVHLSARRQQHRPAGATAGRR